MTNTLDNPKRPIVIRDLTGGLNQKLHPIFLQNNMSAGLQDVDHSTPGILQTRKGFTAIANEINSAYTIYGLSYARVEATSSERNLLAWVNDGSNNTQLYKWVNGTGSWTAIGVTGAAFTAADDVFMLFVNNVVYISQADSNGIHYSDLTANTVAPGTTNTSIPIGHIMAWWLGRIWVAGNTTAMSTPFGTAIKPGYVWFSDPLPTVSFNSGFDRTNNAIACGFGTGQRVVELMPIRSNELIVFLNGSIERIEPVDSDIFGLAALGIPTPQAFRKDIIDPLIGCGSKKTCQLLGSDILFMDQYGSVRSLQRTALDASQGTKSLPLSDPINDGSAASSGIFNINKSQLKKATAIVFGSKYFISIPTGSSTSNDSTYVFDVTLGSWTGPYNYGFSQFVVADVVTSGVWKLYGIKFSTPARVYEIESGTSDNGTAIEYQETTKRYDFGDFDRQKIGKLLIVDTVATDNTTMLAEASTDGSGFSSLGTFNIGGSGGTLPQNLPFTLGGGGIVKGKFHLESLARWNDIQFRFTMNTLDAATKKIGHTIIATFETIRKED